MVVFRFKLLERLRATCITDCIQHRLTPRYLFQYMKYSDSKSSKSMSSLSFNNQSDSFSSDLNGFKKSQAHYQKKITELSKWNVEKTSVSVRIIKLRIQKVLITNLNLWLDQRQTGGNVLNTIYTFCKDSSNYEVQSPRPSAMLRV